MDTMTIGQRIKNKRIELGLTVDELASKLGKNRATIYRYEKDDIKDLPITVLEPLAQILNTTTAYLLGIDDTAKDFDSRYLKYITPNSIAFEITGRSLQYSPNVYNALISWVKENHLNLDSALYTKKGSSNAQNLYEILTSSDTSYDEKAAILNALIDFTILDTKNSSIQIFIDMDANVPTQQQKLSHVFTTLNDTALTRILEYANALASMSTYSKKYDDSCSVSTQATIQKFQKNQQPTTLAAHHEGNEYTEDELKEIDQFAEFVKNKRK